jgi:hypothetical protein
MAPTALDTSSATPAAEVAVTPQVHTQIGLEGKIIASNILFAYTNFFQLTQILKSRAQIEVLALESLNVVSQTEPPKFIQSTSQNREMNSKFCRNAFQAVYSQSPPM